MVAGSDVPFMLRPSESEDPKIKGFRLTGECYLREYMHSEEVKDNPDIVQKLEPIVLV
jgi:hypothetical protein